MKKTIILLIFAVSFVSLFAGCSAQRAEKTGFLSDYSKLEAQSDVSFRYLNPDNCLGSYSKFIINPVIIHFHSKAKSKGKLTAQQKADMTNYMHNALVEAIEDRYEIVYAPGPGVARMKVAITDLKKSGVVQNIVPIGKAIGSGLGGASVEAELLDSQTNNQIAALVESQLGKRLSLDGYSTWGDSKAIMDGWAKRFRQRLDEAHGSN